MSETSKVDQEKNLMQSNQEESTLTVDELDRRYCNYSAAKSVAITHLKEVILLGTRLKDASRPHSPLYCVIKSGLISHCHGRWNMIQQI
jgi:hypothetical protein